MFCQTCLLGYKVVQFLFLLDFFISWKLVSLFAMLINVILTAAYRNTCLCSDTRQTLRNYGYQLQVFMFLSMLQWLQEALFCVPLFCLVVNSVEEWRRRLCSVGIWLKQARVNSNILAVQLQLFLLNIHLVTCLKRWSPGFLVVDVSWVQSYFFASSSLESFTEAKNCKFSGCLKFCCKFA